MVFLRLANCTASGASSLRPLISAARCCKILIADQNIARSHRNVSACSLLKAFLLLNAHQVKFTHTYCAHVPPPPPPTQPRQALLYRMCLTFCVSALRHWVRRQSSITKQVIITSSTQTCHDSGAHQTKQTAKMRL